VTGRTGTCPDCGRTGLKLSPSGLLPRHKATGEPESWPNPNAAHSTGWCKGGGRWIGDAAHIPAVIGSLT
jgi:hypothetical protein